MTYGNDAKTGVLNYSLAMTPICRKMRRKRLTLVELLPTCLPRKGSHMGLAQQSETSFEKHDF